DVRAPRRRPRDGQLRGRDALRVREFAHARDKGVVVLVVAGLEARRHRPYAEVRVAAADQAAPEHAVGRDADAEFAAGGQDAVLDVAAEQRVLDLQVADGRDGGGPADRVGADLGQADVTHVTLVDHLGDRTDGVLDRHGR